MPLKIFHTGDLHIGMKYNNYPDYIKTELIEARFLVLERMIHAANEEQCHLFVVAGDLFDKINIPARDVSRVTDIMKGFGGDAVLVLPGNHDYDNGMVELWERFKREMGGKSILLNEYRPYSLKDFDLDALIYPAHCDAKHSASNRLDWIRKLEDREEAKWEIGIAHGALSGLSPDLAGSYFNMSARELEELNMDLWLLGHTHLPYPVGGEIRERKVYNAGTPEPDGLDCRHQGQGWLINLTDDGKATAKAVETGYYSFKDLIFEIEDETDLENIAKELVKDKPEQTIARLTLKGRVEADLFQQKEEYYRQLKEKMAFLEIEDSGLRMKISEEIIEKEFASNSFPHLLLSELAGTEEDDDALQIAYELIKEVRG